MDNIFAKMEENFDMDVYLEDFQTAKENTIIYKDVPVGEYVVTVNKMEVGTSKKGNPQVVVWFRIQEGEYKNQLLFSYHGLASGQQMYFTNTFLNGFNTNIDLHNWLTEDGRPSFEKYADNVLDIYERIEGQEFIIKYSKNDKGFNQYQILGKNEPIDDAMGDYGDGFIPTDEDIPF